MLPFFFFLFSFLASSLASHSKKGIEWRQNILNKLNEGVALDVETTQSINNEVDNLDDKALEALQPLNGNALKIVLHPTNYNDFIVGGLSVDSIKSKLKPKSFTPFKIGEAEITKEMQEKIFDSMSINEITDYLMKDSKFIDSKCDVFKNEDYSQFIQNMISSRLGGIATLPTKFLEVLLSPLNYKLILSYRSDSGLTLSEHVKSQLCPDSLFTLASIGISVTKEMQQEIFKLLELEQIANILIEDKDVMGPNCDLLQIIKKPEIIRHLRDTVLWNHPSKVVKILAEIDELTELPRYIPPSYIIHTYSDLYKVIQEMILYKKLEEPYQENRLCPDNFFILEDTGISVTKEKQQKIFKLLDLKQIAKILVENEDVIDLKCDLLQIIAKPEIIKKLRNQVVRRYKSKVAEILSEIPKLKKLPQHLDKYDIYSYSDLCKHIQEFKVLDISEKLEEPYKENKLCPDNFFILEDTGISVTKEKQQEIFKLLELKQIAHILVEDEYVMDPKCDLLQIIKKPEIVEKLRDRVVSSCLSELVQILAQIPELKELPRYLDNYFTLSYSDLCKKIQEMIPYKK